MVAIRVFIALMYLCLTSCTFEADLLSPSDDDVPSRAADVSSLNSELQNTDESDGILFISADGSMRTFKDRDKLLSYAKDHLAEYRALLNHYGLAAEQEAGDQAAATWSDFAIKLINGSCNSTGIYWNVNMDFSGTSRGSIENILQAGAGYYPLGIDFGVPDNHGYMILETIGLAYTPFDESSGNTLCRDSQTVIWTFYGDGCYQPHYQPSLHCRFGSSGRDLTKTISWSLARY